MMKDISFGIWKNKKSQVIQKMYEKVRKSQCPTHIKQSFFFLRIPWCHMMYSDGWLERNAQTKEDYLYLVFSWVTSTNTRMKSSLRKDHEKWISYLKAKWLLVSCGILMLIYIKTFRDLKRKMKGNLVNFVVDGINCVCYEIHLAFVFEVNDTS